MKQYKFTVVVRSPMDIKDIVWAFTHKLKDAFTVVSLDFAEIDTRPTSTEHHGGDLDSLDNYNPRPEEEIANDYHDDINYGNRFPDGWYYNNIPERY